MTGSLDTELVGVGSGVGGHRGQGKDRVQEPDEDDGVKDGGKVPGRRLTDDCVPPRDDAVQDAVEHDAVREQGGHDLTHHPAKRSSCKWGGQCKEGRGGFPSVALKPVKRLEPARVTYGPGAHMWPVVVVVSY